jgi:MFS family permease
VSRLVEIVLPAHLGRRFRWLAAAVTAANLGDGVALAAGPLLVASLTSDAFLVALAATLQWLPRLLLAVPAGVVSDRFERAHIAAAVNAVRVIVLAILVVTVAVDVATITLVLLVLLALACAEVFVDSATGAIAPTLVDRADLPIVQSRLQFGFITLNQLAGPPIGAALFVAGAAWPFAGQALLVAAAALLVLRVGRTREPVDATATASGSSFFADAREGLVWAFQHPAVRTLTVTIALFNVTFGAAWSVLVLYTQDRLGLGSVGFGVVTTVSAVGGLLGTASYGWITRHVSLGVLMRIGLIVETLTHLALALITSAWLALPVFFVFGAHAFIWGATSTTVRQAATPAHLQGRVGSANTIGVFGGLVFGSLVGGALAQAWGVTAPFWFAFAGSAVFVVVLWHQFAHIAHDDALPS